MPINVDALWANAPDDSSDPVYDAADLRRADASMFAGTGSGFGVQGGIVLHATNSLGVTIDAADLVTIQPGAAVIPGNAVAGTGCYRTALPSEHTETLTARDVTNARIDRVIFRMWDVDVVGTHTGRTGRIEILPGTPGASPTVPTLPTMAIELARINVPVSGGGTATVDSTNRTFATAIGGTLLVTSSSKLPAASSLYQSARALDTGAQWLWNGSAWVTGPGTFATFTPTMATGWSSSSAQYLERNGDVEIRMTVTRTGSALTANASGNITDNNVFTAGNPVPPAIGVYDTFSAGGSFSGTWRVDTDGSGQITDFHPTAEITNGLVLQLRAKYYR